jgi:uncharacterized protein
LLGVAKLSVLRKLLKETKRCLLMPVNVGPEYVAAEKKYLDAKTLDEKMKWLEEMIRVSPKHKSSENFVSELKMRLRKLQDKQEKEKKKGKSSKVGIRKESMQAVIVGFANSGKSSLLSILTNAKPRISHNNFSTTNPQIGMMSYDSADIQLIENPAIDSEYYDKGLTNTTDTVIMLITKLEEINEIEKHLDKTNGKKVLVINKIDLLSENEKRKIEANLKSKFKKYEFVLISSLTGEGIEELKGKLFHSFGKLRIYTKEPGKQKTNRPIILEPNSSVRDVAEKILKGFSKKVKETKIWGPSSKFAGQIVGLNHKLKDLDVVEFKTR